MTHLWPLIAWPLLPAWLWRKWKMYRLWAREDVSMSIVPRIIKRGTPCRVCISLKIKHSAALAAKDAEIARLREVVGDAYAEGYEMGYGDARDDAEARQDGSGYESPPSIERWQKSIARRALEETE